MRVTLSNLNYMVGRAKTDQYIYEDVEDFVLRQNLPEPKYTNNIEEWESIKRRAIYDAVRDYNGRVDFIKFLCGVVLPNRLASFYKMCDRQIETEELENSILIEDPQPSDFRNRVDRYLKPLCSELEFKVYQLWLDSYTYTEIAEELEIPLKSVDNAAIRVKKKLQKLKDVVADFI